MKKEASDSIEIIYETSMIFYISVDDYDNDEVDISVFSNLNLGLQNYKTFSIAKPDLDHGPVLEFITSQDIFKVIQFMYEKNEALKAEIAQMREAFIKLNAALPEALRYDNIETVHPTKVCEVLIEHFKHSPDGIGYERAKEHFDELRKD